MIKTRMIFLSAAVSITLLFSAIGAQNMISPIDLPMESIPTCTGQMNENNGISTMSSGGLLVSKQIWDEGSWVDATTASIGDSLLFKIFIKLELI